MNDQVSNLVDSLIQGDSVKIENTFNTIMAQKISTELENTKQRIGNSLFSSNDKEE